MASAIWNPKEKRWRLRVMVDGQLKCFSSSTPGITGKKEVMRRARMFEESGAGFSDRSFGACWSLFLEDVAARSSAANYKNVAQLGRLYILPVLEHRRMSQLRLSEVQRCINSATKKDGTPLSHKSVSNIKNALTSFLLYARRDGCTDLVPSGLYVPVNRPSIGKNILTQEQVARLFNDFENEFYINLWRLMLCTGMRPGEALGLKWEDLQGFRLNICRSINRDRVVTPGKNKNARRSIPVNSLIEEILKNQKARTEYLDSCWIFPSPSGDMPSQSTAYNSMHRISEALGVKVSPYSLRACFVSLLKTELPEAYMKQIIGHSTAMPTYSGPYAHDLAGEKEQAAAIIDEALRKIL